VKFTGMHIDGFGIFHDFKFDDLSDGLTIIHGPNEAGKSTLLAFQNRVLFGFPDARSRLNLYPPIHGGNHGGRIDIKTEEGSKLTVERYPDNHHLAVYLPDGTNGGEVELSKALGYSDKSIYENIYAFGLSELQDFDTLKSDSIRDRLYSAGTGTGSVSLSEVQNDLDKEINKLFKERGSNPEINSLFREIKEINSSLRDIELDQKNFDDSHRRMNELLVDIKEITENRNDIRSRHTHVENLIQAWDSWRTLKESKESLEEIPEIKKFPDKGIDKLERSSEKIEELNGQISSDRDELQKLNIERSNIEVDEDILKSEKEIIGLQKGQEKFSTAQNDLPELIDKKDNETRELNEHLKEIGPNWDVNKLDAFDSSIPTKESIRKRHQKIVDFREAIGDTRRSIKEVEEKTSDLVANRNEIKENIDRISSSLVGDEAVQEKRNAVYSLRTKLPKLMSSRSDLKNLHERQDLLSAIKPAKTEKQVGYPVWPLVLILSMGLILLVSSIVFGNWALSGIILGTSLISFVVYLVIFWMKRSSMKTDSEPRVTDKDSTKKIKDASKRINILEKEISRLEKEVLSYAKMLGFNDIPEIGQVETKDSEIQEMIRYIDKYNELGTQKKKIDKKIKEHNNDLETIRKRLKELEEKEKELIEKWRTWLKDKDLDPELSPEGVIDIFSTIKICKDKKRSLQDLENRLEKVEGFIDSYRSKMKEVMKSCNIEKEDFDAIVELERLVDKLESNKKDLKRLEQIDIDVKKFNQSMETAEGRLQTEMDSISELLKEGSAESEEEFRTNFENWNKRRNLEEVIDRSEREIKKISGDGDPYQRFTEELEYTTPEELDEREKLLGEDLDTIEEKLSEKREILGGIKKEIEQIEHREEGSSLRLERDVKMEKLEKKAEEWSCLTLAKMMIKKAIERYEKERQPGVIKESRSFFSSITQGKYPNIYAPLDETVIYVEDKDGKRKNILELSRGTAEQLYLSLRFGFIKDFNKRAKPLPVIFDDILVNFDPDRFRSACDAIKELTKTNQVLYYTCHPITVETLKGVMPEAKVIDLSRT